MKAQILALDGFASPVAARGGSAVPLSPQKSASRPANHAGFTSVFGRRARRGTYQHDRWARLKQAIDTWL